MNALTFLMKETISVIRTSIVQKWKEDIMSANLTIKMLIDDCEVTITVLKEILNKTDLPVSAMEILTRRIINCEAVVRQAKANTALAEFKGELVNMATMQQSNIPNGSKG